MMNLMMYCVILSSLVLAADTKPSDETLGRQVLEDRVRVLERLTSAMSENNEEQLHKLKEQIQTTNYRIISMKKSITELGSSSCQAIRAATASAPSGEYIILTSSQRPIRVYCEMGLNGGGYTFLHPSELPRLTDAEVQAIFTNRTSFLLRSRQSNGFQPYAVLTQLPQYSDTPLALYLNRNTGYATPRNVNQLGSNYLYFGFLPTSIASQRNVQGLQVNGVNVAFANCDGNPNSYFALFPNFSESVPTNYAQNIDFPMLTSILSAMKQNPSRRVMPEEYFTFFEGHFGGCGLFTQSDGRLDALGVISATIGFR